MDEYERSKILDRISNLKYQCRQSAIKRENLRKDVIDIHAHIEYESGKIAAYREVIDELNKEAYDGCKGTPTKM